MINSQWELIVNKNDLSINKNTKSFISVAIILAYYKGSKFIKEQVQSIIDQKRKSTFLSIFISDDNSQEDFSYLGNLDLSKVQNFNIFYKKNNENLGYSMNFIYALKNINEEFDYYFFSDQDDIWIDTKLKNALNKIKNYPKLEPNLYCGRATYYDEYCENALGNSILFKKKPCFKNAIIQNIAGGNTMVFNHTSKNLIIASIFDNLKIVSHDWWTYQIISGVGGNIYYDEISYIKYRQHSSNIIGSNTSLIAKIKRITSLITGKLKTWNDVNLYALSRNKDKLTLENQNLLEKFLIARNAHFLKRIIIFSLLGIHRQTNLGNLALFFAIIFKKI